MNPLISIVTITYNAQDVIKPTLESVKAQTFHNYEYIVVDGASKDATIDLVKNSGIERMKIISEPDNGLYDAMNKGIDAAHGNYIIFLNAGDSFASENALYDIADTTKRTHADIVYGQTMLVNSNREVLGPRHLTAPSRLSFKSFKNGMLVCHQAFVVRRKIAPKYNLKYKFSADYEWCLRCLKQSKRNAYTGTTLIHYLTEGLTDQNHKSSLLERFKIMCKYYGIVPTLVKHITFIPRYLKEKNRRSSM